MSHARTVSRCCTCIYCEDVPPPTVRMVAEVMSSPVVTTSPDDTVADAATRCATGRSARSSSSTASARSASSPSATSSASASVGPAGDGAKVGEWMTADPDSVAPGLSVQEAFASLAEHGYRHIPVVDGRGARRHRVDARPDADRPDPAGGHPGQIEAPRGLEGVIVAETTVGDVRGLEGFYHYRQYSAIELAEKRSLEDVWYLLFEGDLPTAAERRAFATEVRPLRQPPAVVWRLLPDIAAAGGPLLDLLRTAVSLLGHSQRLPAVARHHAGRAARPTRCRCAPSSRR